MFLKEESMEGKVVLVTGGGSGMGRACALAFGKKGVNVVVSDVVIEKGQETSRMIQEAKGNAIFVKADVSKANEVEALVNNAIKTYNRLDYAFNNAGLISLATTPDCTEEEWDRIIDINLKGVWLCMKYELRHMLAHGGGAIVNNASMEGVHGQPRRPIYCASKHGVIGLTKSAAVAHARAGVRINAVCPGPIRTAQTEPAWRGPQGETKTISRVPLGRVGNPEDIAEAVVWLCSDAASFITGHALVVDGGSIAGLFDPTPVVKD
jgi:NAD(P)-dependent dehydrogenase (short-subunit alcohol dehydrogenase family)